ncbi:TonB-dependent receptor [Nitrospirillum amazonense]|uniref:TonB-dependent siderophore receptor n=1 Tax=Nitrospirillum amazonense TaxID=28077 RepID=UPI002DD441BF|nr:TonB-dependent receptor [Nitrospirillum amazonense]MEC4589661.1 TonB-dependent receptor [Nitrospirillum amazonense]
MRIFLFAGASALALGLQPAAAQTAGTPSTTGTQAAAPSWINEVIVTGVREGDAVPNAQSATRTDTPLIQIPQSVQVITGTLLAEQDAHVLADALVNVSGVTPTQPQEVLFTPPIIRGFPAEVYVDGLPIFGGNQQAFDPASLVGTERIEVLKGPTATLYGGGLGSPLGGLINIVSERPDDKFGGFVALRGGSFSTWNPYGDVNLPLAPGVAARIGAEYQRNDSWIDQVHGEKWAVKPSLSIQLGPQTDLLVQAQVNHNSQLEYSGLPATQALAGQLDRDAFPGATNGQPLTSVDNQIATLALHHTFSDDLKLTVSGRYYNSKVKENGSFLDSGSDPATPTVFSIYALNMLTTTQEGALDANLLAKGDVLGGHHEVLVGASYDYTAFDSGMGFSGIPLGSIDLANPVYNLSFGALQPLDYVENDKYQTIAAYLQDQATYGRLHLTGALRFTNLHFRENQGGPEDTYKSYSHVSPRVGATFDLIPGLALYGSYSTAFRAAFGFVGLQPPQPETSTNYEAGVKLELKELGLSGTVAAFNQTYENVPESDPNNPGFSVQVGEQRARGVEVDFIWEPTPAFSLLANYAYTEAQVTKDYAINGDVGNTLPRVPKNSGRIAARYRILDGAAQGLSFGAGVTAFSARQDTLPNSVWVPGYAMVDAQAAYDFGRYTVEVSAVNLGGSKAYDAYEYFGYPVVMPVQPRSAYVTLKARF